jgi:hypothetical protein
MAINPGRGGFTPRFELQCGGTLAGYTNSVEGGGYGGELVKMDPSSYHLQSMTVAGLNYEPFKCEIALGMSAEMQAWICASIEQRRPTYQSGHLVIGNTAGEGVVSADFEDALIKEIGFPDCDAENQKSAGFCKITFEPTFCEWNPAKGYKLNAPLASAAKDYIPSNFRCEIQGLDCATVTKISGFTFKQEVVKNSTGSRMYAEKIPGKPEIPQFQLEVSVNEDNMHTFLRWVREHLQQGMRDEGRNLVGSLEYLGPDLRSLGELQLISIGLQKYEPLAVKGGEGKPYRWKLHMFVEDIKPRLRHFGGADRSGGAIRI